MVGKIKFLHLRNYTNGIPHSRGGITIAYQLSSQPNVYVLSEAKCNSADVFNKKIGRDVSAGRIKSDSKSTWVDVPIDGMTIEESIIEYYGEHGFYPKPFKTLS